LVIEDIGKVLIDVGKLVLGSIALGGIMLGEGKRLTLMFGGFIASILLIVAGLVLLGVTKE
jgi:hypothetical protein